LWGALANHVGFVASALTTQTNVETGRSLQLHYTKSLAEEPDLPETLYTSLYTSIVLFVNTEEHKPLYPSLRSSRAFFTPRQHFADAFPPTSDEPSSHRITLPFPVGTPSTDTTNFRASDIIHNHGRRSSSAAASAWGQPKDDRR
jgi:hypothetical protein